MPDGKNQSDSQRQIEELQQRIGELETALLKSEKNFRTLTDFAPVGIYLDDAEGRAVFINQKCGELIGVPAHESIDFNWISSLHPDDRDRMVSEWKEAFEHSEEFHSEYRWLHSDGRIVWTLGEVIPILGENGKATMFIGALTDITTRKEAEERLKSSLEEKETLLRELYHRTKNTLQIIRSVLLLQADQMSDNEQVQELVRNTESRIMAMALVHQKLYQAHDLSRIPMREYIRELAELSVQNAARAHNISLVFEVEPVSLLIDTAIPFGLILNELLSNALKHAFPDRQQGSITLRMFQKNPDYVSFSFSDDGVGMPPEFADREQTTLGLQTVFAIAEKQMRGTVGFTSTSGVSWTIEFPNSLYTERV